MTTLLTGATGNVGPACVRDLLHAGEPVRVLTRDAGRAARLLGPAPELVQADPTDRHAVDAALADADRVYLASGNHPGQVQAEQTVIHAAAAAGVDRLVKLSGPAPHPRSPLLPERWHAEIEAHLEASGLASVVLRPASFLTNLAAFAEPVTAQGVLPAPTAGAQVAFVDPEDVGAMAAALLLAPELPAERVVRVTGPVALTYEDVAAALGRAAGRPVAFVPMTETDAAAAMRAAGLPEEMVEVLLAVYRLQRQGAFATVSDAVPAVLGRPARSIDEFLAEHPLPAPRSGHP